MNRLPTELHHLANDAPSGDSSGNGHASPGIITKPESIYQIDSDKRGRRNDAEQPVVVAETSENGMPRDDDDVAYPSGSKFAAVVMAGGLALVLVGLVSSVVYFGSLVWLGRRLMVECTAQRIIASWLPRSRPLRTVSGL